MGKQSSPNRDAKENSNARLRVDGLPWREASGEDFSSKSCRTEGLTLQAGQITLLLGPNGAGKTTLMEKLAGLRDPEGLRIGYGHEELWLRSRFGGRKLRLNAKALLRYAYASQSPEEGLFARSVRDELDYSLRPYRISVSTAESRRSEALAAVGWGPEREERDPYAMSGGERRRTALAATFVAPADWLLLDEPTSGLDGEGHERIAGKLKALREAGTGVLLVSHDTDWALPLADRVLLLNGAGEVLSCARDRLLEHPEWMEEAGLAVPAWLSVAARLRLAGIPAKTLWHPGDAAMAWPGGGEGNEVRPPVANAVSVRDGKAPVVRPVRRECGKKHRLQAFDPRSVWLGYVLLSFGLLQLRSWGEAAVGAAIVALLLIAGRVSLRRWRVLIVHYAIFSVLTSAIFAWGAGGDWQVRAEAFSATSFAFVRTFVVLLIGLAIPLVMTPLSLRRSLEQMVARRGKVPQAAQRVILTIALVVRFVPVLLELWERFAKLIRARGKTVSYRPAALVGRLRDISLPFLLALFRLGDEVALVLESRGVGEGRSPTRPARMKWRSRDYVLAVGLGAISAGLWLLARS